MEQAKNKFKADVKLLRKAIQTLEEALLRTQDQKDDLLRDGAIQRFEYCFELAWKTLQVAGRFMGIEINSPCEAIKSGFKLGWIKHPDRWFEVLEARNQTSHIYNDKVAREVYAVARKFPSLIHEIIAAVEKNVK